MKIFFVLFFNVKCVKGFFEIFFLIVIKCYICIVVNEKICSCCSRYFRVNLDGIYVFNLDEIYVCKKEVCFYYWGKELMKKNGIIMFFYVYMLNIKEVGIKRLLLYLC